MAGAGRGRSGYGDPSPPRWGRASGPGGRKPAVMPATWPGLLGREFVRELDAAGAAEFIPLAGRSEGRQPSGIEQCGPIAGAVVAVASPFGRPPRGPARGPVGDCHDGTSLEKGGELGLEPGGGPQAGRSGRLLLWRGRHRGSHNPPNVRRFGTGSNGRRLHAPASGGRPSRSRSSGYDRGMARRPASTPFPRRRCTGTANADRTRISAETESMQMAARLPNLDPYEFFVPSADAGPMAGAIAVSLLQCTRSAYRPVRFALARCLRPASARVEFAARCGWR
jgi:hypothetical protein